MEKEEAMFDVTLSRRSWPLHEPFEISRGVQRDTPCIVVEIFSDGACGRGEGIGVNYAGETPDTMIAQIEAVMPMLRTGITRAQLCSLLPAGGARCAIDSALWDWEAKRTGIPAWQAAGLPGLAAVHTVYSIGIRSLAEYEATAARYAAFAMLKVKVANADPVAAVRAVRSGAPNSALIIDPNQAWSVDRLKELAPAMADLGVVLLEQPIPVGAEDGLVGYRCPVALCADELIQDRSDLARAEGRFDVINIKLDKTGGLTEGLALADEAESRGLKLMVGCMAGSSLAMAPAHLLAQRCAYVDIDGPLLQSEDWPGGLVYRDGVVEPPTPAFWG